MATSDDFEAALAQGTEPRRVQALRDYLDAEVPDLITDRNEFLGWCRSIFGARNTVPKSRDIASYTDAVDIVERVVAVDGAWSNLDDRLVDCLLSRKDIHAYAVPALFERAVAVCAEATLVERLDKNGIDQAKTALLLFDRAPFMKRSGSPTIRAVRAGKKTSSSNESTVTAYGAKVLAMPPAQAVALAAATRGATKLASLYLRFMPERFDEVQLALLEATESPMAAAYLLGPMADHGAHPVADFVEKLIARLGPADAEPVAHFVAAFHLQRGFPEHAARAFALAESFARGALAAEDNPSLWPTSDFANGHTFFKTRLIEWLLSTWGVAAKKIVAGYRDENYALRVSVYPLIVEHLGQDAVEILVAGLTAQMPDNVRGFLEHEAYYQRVLQLLAPLDTTKYDVEIREALLTHENPKVRAMAQRVFEHDATETRTVSGKVSWALKEFAEGVVVVIADALAQAAGRKRIEHVAVGLMLEDDPAVRTVGFSSKDGDEERPCAIALEFDAGRLKRFLKRHTIKDSDQFDLGNSEKPPLSLLLYELTEACRALPALLRHRNVTLAEGCSVTLDGHDVEHVVDDRAGSVRRGIASAFVDNHAAREFARLCYKDPERRAWLESLAKPLIHYTLL